MQFPEYFFLIFIITILITRIFLSLNQISSPIINKIKLHHYMYGIILIISAFAFRNLTLFAIGLALFIDEFLLLIRYGNNFHWKEYNSKYSRVGIIFLVISVYFLKEFLVFF